MKKQIPLLMSAMMVQAILALRKLMTRRLKGLEEINKDPGRYEFSHFEVNAKGGLNVVFRDLHESLVHKQPVDESIPCPYGKPGDILWVRETWQPWLRGDGADGSVQLIKYAADNAELPFTWVKDYDDYRNRPGIHMNKEYCRIWLEVTDIWVERLQDISEDDAKAEGLAAITKDDGRTWKYGIPDKDGYPGTDDNGWPWHKWSTDPKESFFRLWAQINGEESLRQDPWLWVISFRVLSTTGKPAELEKEEAV